jgi:hypothetical protein
MVIAALFGQLTFRGGQFAAGGKGPRASSSVQLLAAAGPCCNARTLA